VAKDHLKAGSLQQRAVFSIGLPLDSFAGDLAAAVDDDDNAGDGTAAVAAVASQAHKASPLPEAQEVQETRI